MKPRDVPADGRKFVCPRRSLNHFGWAGNGTLESMLFRTVSYCSPGFRLFLQLESKMVLKKSGMGFALSKFILATPNTLFFNFNPSFDHNNAAEVCVSFSSSTCEITCTPNKN
jgi:hypothetical protein